MPASATSREMFPRSPMWLDDRSCLAPAKSGARPRSGLSDELAKEHHKLGWLANVSGSGSWSSHWSSGFEINPQERDCDGAVGQTLRPMVQSQMFRAK